MAATRRMAQKKAPESDVQNGSKGEQNPPKSKAIKTDTFWDKLAVWDEEITSVVAVCANKDAKYSQLRPMMKLLEISCHGIPWILGSIVVLLSVHKADDVEILVNLVAALLVDIVVIASLKMAFRRSRPQHNEMDMFATVSIDKYSFPSGHATRAALLMCFFASNVLSSRLNVALVIVWAVVVSMSRVILGRHHILDVVCGFIVGCLNYFIVMYIWVPRDTCLELLEIYFSHFHL